MEKSQKDGEGSLPFLKGGDKGLVEILKAGGKGRRASPGGWGSGTREEPVHIRGVDNWGGGHHSGGRGWVILTTDSVIGLYSVSRSGPCYPTGSYNHSDNTRLYTNSPTPP